MSKTLEQKVKEAAEKFICTRNRVERAVCYEQEKKYFIDGAKLGVAEGFRLAIERMKTINWEHCHGDPVDWLIEEGQRLGIIPKSGEGDT